MKVACTNSPRTPSPLESSIRLAGNCSHHATLPEHCPECQGKEFYKQSDFKRSIGVGLVSFASIITFVLMYMGFNWFVIWSPMLVMLFFDRILLRLRPVVAICYSCKHVLRGLDATELAALESFDLEVYDRYQYREENSQ